MANTAQGWDTTKLCNELDDVQKAAAGCEQTIKEVPTVVNTIVGSVTGIVGLLAVVFIIVGAIQYITSSGDAAKVNKAKNTILYSVIGLVLALLSYAIANFVISHVQ